MICYKHNKGLYIVKISKKVESALINHKRKLSLLLHNALDGKQLKGNKAQEYNSMMISDIADHINFINLSVLITKND